MVQPTRVAKLTDRAFIRVSGPEARGFLHNLLTQDVESLGPGELRHGALLTPQGRLQHELFMLGEPDGLLLDTPAAGRDALLARLRIYKLRAKATVEAVDGEVYAAWSADPNVPPPPPVGAVVDPRLPALGWRLYGAAPAPTSATADHYDAHRLALGVPDAARDCAEDTYPIEANFDLLNGIDFRKGCFVGQETTSRMKRRGVIKSRMVPLRFDGEPPHRGAEVLAGTLRAGEVRSGRTGIAMALMRLDRALNAALTVEGRQVSPAPPPWLDFAPQALKIIETTA